MSPLQNSSETAGHDLKCSKTLFFVDFSSKAASGLLGALGASRVPLGCLLGASWVPSGCHSKDSTAGIPQQGFHSRDSTAESPQQGFHSRDSTAEIPPGYLKIAIWGLVLGS